MGDVAMMERRFISAHMDLVMLNVSFDFYTILWDFYKQKFVILICMCRRRSVRFLCFPLETTMFELNFSAMEIA